MATKTLQYNFIQKEVRPNTIADVKVDASFRRIPKNAICFHVWKIDEDRLEAEPKSQYGTFLDDCAYIIYAAAPVGSYVNQDTITREVKPSVNLERFIHFWLGEKVSEQKRSNVAHKIQELDSYFSNVAVEYRETQNNESARFLSYFKRGLTIKCGLLVTSSDPNRLYQVYGRKWLRCIEMKSIAWEHFGADYVMLLATANHFYVWIGRSSSSIERRNAIDLANKWQTDPSKITIVDDGYEQSMPDKCKNEWNTFLPLSQRAVCQNSPAIEKPICNKLKIYKCCYRNNRLHLDQLDVVIPTREDFSDSTTAYVLDGFSQGVWLWVGSQATQQDKTSAMGNGRAFVKKKKYPYSTPVIRVIEGHEPSEFIRLFPSWHSESNDMHMKPISTILGKFDSMTLCQRPKMAAETQLIDDGTGERKIYRITKDQVIEMPTTKAVYFNTHNAYVIQYTVVSWSMNPNDSESVGIKHIIYQWNGSEASADITSKAEKFAINLFESINSKSMYIQMGEYDETPHFLQMFEGKLIILLSEKDIPVIQSNNNNNTIITNGHEEKDTLILKVYGDSTYNAKAVEVYPLVSMSSKECYVVKSQHVWVWCGQSSTGDARELAKNVGALLGESSLALEGKEPKEFWRSVTNLMNQSLILNGLNQSHNSLNTSNGGSSSMGSPSPINSNGSVTGNTQYLTSPSTKTPRFQAQLFAVWTLRNKFFCEEILGYDQTDLSPECAYILDAGIISYVWLGKNVSTYEKDKYLSMAQNYLETVPIARRPTTAIGVIRQHDEPNVFKGFFDNWNTNLWNSYVNYEQTRQILSKGSPSLTNGNGVAPLNGENGKLPPSILNNQKDFDRHQKYPIAILQQEIDLLPEEINPLKREVHLTHDDFVSLFNMSFYQFDELPAWKKQELKKKHKLF
ncbi:villin-like protein quail isoform X1 [Stomoxys calcitrans]|uniref:villin-like protein quail isoform X1 n=1 Tax=Stomoxys calcitrans TaxID=35570 RepID=UPI0027E27E2F|nr:villin-like protein quail isoform X1 [Stomoxys calcitrans]